MKEFIEHVKKQLASTKTELRLVKATYVVEEEDDDIPENRCGGFYDDTKRELVVATGGKTWCATLAHEYSHYQQWLDGYDFGDYDECMDDLALYTRRKSVTRARAVECVRSIQRVEIDAERRTLDLIRSWGLPVDPRSYLQDVYVDLLWYDMIAHTGQWPDRDEGSISALARCISVPDTLDRIPHYTRYEKLFYVYGVFDPPKKRYVSPNWASEAI